MSLTTNGWEKTLVFSYNQGMPLTSTSANRGQLPDIKKIICEYNHLTQELTRVWKVYNSIKKNPTAFNKPDCFKKNIQHFQQFFSIQIQLCGIYRKIFTKVDSVRKFHNKEPTLAKTRLTKKEHNQYESILQEETNTVEDFKEETKDGKANLKRKLTAFNAKILEYIQTIQNIKEGFLKILNTTNINTIKRWHPLYVLRKKLQELKEELEKIFLEFSQYEKRSA